MKKMLIILVPVTMFFSCKKNDTTPDPQQAAFATFQGKYLVCDSVKTTLNSATTTQVLGKGKGWDLNFGLYDNLEVYTLPATTYKSYVFTSPDKIYYWTTSYQSSQYYTVQSMAGSKMVLTDTDQATGKLFTEYFTAQ